MWVYHKVSNMLNMFIGIILYICNIGIHSEICLERPPIKVITVWHRWLTWSSFIFYIKKYIKYVRVPQSIKHIKYIYTHNFVYVILGYTVKLVLKNRWICPVGLKNVICQNRWSLVMLITGLVILKCGTFSQDSSVWSFQTDGLSHLSWEVTLTVATSFVQEFYVK